MITSIYRRAITRNIEQSTRQLAAEEAGLIAAQEDEVAAEAAYAGLPPADRSGLARDLVPWLLVLSLAMEVPGAWMAAAAAMPDGLTLLALAAALSVAGLLLGWLVGRARATLDRTEPGADAAWKFRIALALAISYLAMLLSLRLEFAQVIIGSSAAVLAIMIVSALGLLIAYCCETDVESPEAFRRRSRMREAAIAAAVHDRRHATALENYQVAIAEGARSAEATKPSVNYAVMATVLVGFAMATFGGHASAETTYDLTQSTLAACRAERSAPLPTRSHVTLLVLGGSQVEGARRERYEQIASQTIASACASSATLEIRAIGSAGTLDSDVVFSESAPRGNGNPFALVQSRAEFADRATTAVAHLYDRPTRGNSDVVAAIREAADEMRGIARARFLIVASHGWPNQTFRAGEDPRREMPTVIRMVRNTGGLDLHGVNVFLAGIAATSRMGVTTQDLFELCQAWRTFVAAFGGAFGDCGSHLPARF